MVSERIVFENQQGGLTILVPALSVEDAKKDIPETVAIYKTVNDSDIPTDRTFRKAWRFDTVEQSGIKTDMPEARLIAHGMRRNKRSGELAPLDIEATIPSKANAAEAARQLIRDKYAVMQADIDNAANEAALKTVLSNGGVL